MLAPLMMMMAYATAQAAAVPSPAVAPATAPAKPAATVPAAPPALPPAAQLPVIHLDVKGPISHDRKTPCTLRFTFPGTKLNNDTAAGDLRYHGASSLGMPKKSFALTLDDAVAIPGLRKSAHWVLNAAYIDRSLMRHKLSYDLFRALSAEGAPRVASGSRFIELQLNDRYEGVYLLMERVDRSLAGLRKNADGQLARSCMYKVIDHSSDFARPGHRGYEQREPDADDGPYWGPLDEFTTFTATAPDAEFFDPANGIGSRLDLDNAIDFHLLLLFTSNIDGNDKNFILARDAVLPGKPPPKFFFIPWDYDATFGRSWNAQPVGAQQWLSSYLFDKLLRDAEYRKRFTARWKELREGPFSVARVQGMIDENVRALGDAPARNWERWKNAGGYPDQLAFEEDIAAMKKWVEDRTAWLDKEIARRTKE
jgi:hypothetical protein